MEKIIINKTTYTNCKATTGVFNSNLNNVLDYTNLVDIFFKCSQHNLLRKSDMGSIFLPTEHNKVFVEFRYDIKLNEKIKVYHTINLVMINNNSDIIPRYDNIIIIKNIINQPAYLNAKDKEKIYNFYCAKMTEVRKKLTPIFEKMFKEEKRKRDIEQHKLNIELAKKQRVELKKKMDILFEEAQEREKKKKMQNH